MLSTGVPVQIALQKVARALSARHAINYHSVLSENFGKKTGLLKPIIREPLAPSREFSHHAALRFD